MAGAIYLPPQNKHAGVAGFVQNYLSGILQQALTRHRTQDIQQLGTWARGGFQGQMPPMRTEEGRQYAQRLSDPYYQAQLEAARARTAYYERPTGLTPSQQISAKTLEKIKRLQAKEAAGTITRAEQMTLDKKLMGPPPLTPSQKIAQRRLDKIDRLQKKVNAGTATKAEQIVLDKMLDALPPKPGAPVIKDYYDKETDQMMIMQWNEGMGKWDKTGIAAERPEEEKLPTTSELRAAYAQGLTPGTDDWDRTVGVRPRKTAKGRKVYDIKTLNEALWQYTDGHTKELKEADLRALKMMVEQSGYRLREITTEELKKQWWKPQRWEGTEKKSQWVIENAAGEIVPPSIIGAGAAPGPPPTGPARERRDLVRKREQKVTLTDPNGQPILTLPAPPKGKVIAISPDGEPGYILESEAEDAMVQGYQIYR